MSGRFAYEVSKRLPKVSLTLYMVLFFIFLLGPIAVVVAISFTTTEFVSFPPKGFTWRWYQRFFDYEPFVNSFIVSIELAVATALLGAFLGVPAALAVVRGKVPYANTIMTYLLSPLSMPLIVVGFALLFYLSAMGLGVSFLSLLIAHTVISVPYIIRTVAGVYRGVSPDYEETAAVLGANRIQIFWHVTLPMIKPGIFAGMLFAMLISIDNLPISFFFGSFETNTLPVVMLSYLEHQFDPSVAAASSIQLLVAVIGLIIVERIYGLDAMAPAA
jgi:putative spermidine/putrescine transport system permease protein